MSNGGTKYNHSNNKYNNNTIITSTLVESIDEAPSLAGYTSR